MHNNRYMAWRYLTRSLEPVFGGDAGKTLVIGNRGDDRDFLDLEEEGV
jgi:hypothetical protein